MLGVGEVRLNHLLSATVTCIITGCEGEADLMTRQDEICEKVPPRRERAN